MKWKLNKKKYLAIAFLVALAIAARVFAQPNPGNMSKKARIEPGIYVLVSFSVNDKSLRSYFLEAQHYKARLVMRGLPGEKNSRNRFATAKAKMEQARINVDINPVIFDQLNIKHVPAFVVIKANGEHKKISGHISLQKALEMMEEERK